MILHFSWTVLATIIWISSFHVPAQELISKEIRVLESEKVSISKDLTKQTDGFSKRVITEGAIKKEESNDETNSVGDTEDLRINNENDRVEDATANVVGKRHVREYLLSQTMGSTRISTENIERNDAYVEATEYEETDNNNDDVFQRYPELESVFESRDSDWDTNSARRPGSKESEVAEKKNVTMKNDNVESNGSSLEEIVYTNDALNLTEIPDGSISLITSTDTSGMKPEIHNSNSQTRGSEYYGIRSKSKSKTRHFNDRIRFIRYSSLHKVSRKKDQTVGKRLESPRGERINEHGTSSPSKTGNTLAFLRSNIEAGNDGKWNKSKKKSLAEHIQNPIMQQKRYYRNAGDAMPERTPNAPPWSANIISEQGTTEKIQPFRRGNGQSSADELQKIIAQGTPNLAIEKSEVEKLGIKPVDSSYFTKVESRLKKQSNRFTVSSNVDRREPMGSVSSDVISRESLEQLSGQILKPPHSRSTELHLSRENKGQDYEHTTAKYSFKWTLYPRVSSESQYTKESHSLSPEKREFYRLEKTKPKIQRINYQGMEQDDYSFSSKPSLNDDGSEINYGTSTIVSASTEYKNELSWEELFNGAKSTEGLVSLTTLTSGDNRMSSSSLEFVDNPINLDSKTKLHENVVNTKLTSLQRNQDSRITFIAPKSANDNDPLSHQKRVEQDQEKYVQKVTLETNPMEIDDSRLQKNEKSSSRETLVNSEASSGLWLVVKRKNNLLESIANLTNADSKTINFSLAGDITGKKKNGTEDGERGMGLSAKEFTKVSPRPVQFLPVSAAEDNNTTSNGSAVTENREYSMENIYETFRANASSSMSSPLTEVYQWDSVADEAAYNHRTRNDRGETAKVIVPQGSGLQDDRKFQERLSPYSVDGSHGKVLLNDDDNSKVLDINLSTSVSDTFATTETNIGPVASPEVPSDNRSKTTDEWKVSAIGKSAAINNQDALIFPKVPAILSDDRHDQMTNVASKETLENDSRQHRQQNQAEKNPGRLKKFVHEIKIKKIDNTPIENYSKLRISGIANDKDSSLTQWDTKNHKNDGILETDVRKTCDIVEKLDKNENKDSVKKIFNDREPHSEKNHPRSIIDARVTEPTFLPEIRNESLISVGANFVIDDADSLSYISRESETIDHAKPEKVFDERTRWKNAETLVHGQEPIINGSAVMNSMVQPRSSNNEKLTGSDSREVSVTKRLDGSNESISLLKSKIIPREVISSDRQTVTKDEIYQSKSLRFTESLENRKKILFHNTVSDISPDDENFTLNSTFPTRNGSGSREPWKNLVYDNETTSSTSSRKIDSSVGLIHEQSYSDVSPIRQDPIQHPKLNIWFAEILEDAADASDTGKKKIKRGFINDNTILLSTTEATARHSRDSQSFLTTDTNIFLDAKSADRNVDGLERNESSFHTRSSVIDSVNLTENTELVSRATTSRSIIDETNSLSSGDQTAKLKSLDGSAILESSSTNSSLINSDKSSEIRKVLVNKTMLVSLANPSNINSSITKPGKYSPVLASAVIEQDNNSSDGSSRESGRLQLPRNKHQFHETVENVRGSLDTRNLNETIHDNSTRISATLNQWPVKHSAVVEGDLVLGGLMMVHEREDSVTCGPVMPQGGVQALEAMLYTLDWLNERDLVPGVKIGAHILDDCDKDTYGLEMAVDFIKGSISNIDGAEYHCNKTAVRKVISGVVGAASSVTSIQVANLLRLFRIPQVSFFSTSPELSNKMRFEYFTRTIPSDHYQVKAMVDIVLVMGWSYVSIIYEESNYGEKAYEELEKLLGKHQICIAVKEKLSKDSGVAEAHVYDNIVQKLLTKPRARGCIIFASDQEVAGVMRAVRRCNATGAFSWIGSDGWSARSLVSDGNEREMEGTLSVQPQANPVEGFEDYFLNLTVENNRRNPWFVEFWEDHFKCRYPNSSQTPYNNYTEECTTTEKLTKENTAFEDQLQFVSDAVLAFAYAFRNMHSHLCHGKPGLCDAMKPTKGIELLSYLRTVEFDGLSGDVFHFDKNGDGPARYNIIHFKQISPGEYKWIRVGKYLEGELRLNMSEIQFRLGHPEAPESVCSLPCEVGQAKKYVEGESCCWHCFNCSQDEIRHVNDEKQCVLCPKGTLPDETHSYCRDIPEEFLRPESGWAIGAMSFSSTGILITLFVGGVFLKHNDTPIVRASGRELSYVLLTGILLCYLVTFALVLRPTDLVCSIQRFSAGFCFTVMYAALLTKTNRISRIFNAGKRSAKRPSFISPRSQLIICSMLVSIQILINAVWMVIDPAKARHHYPTREDNLLVCNSYIDASYMIAFTYPIILIVVCTVYAVLTRKIPEAFNESKHIGFTMYTTCVIWLAFVPLYFATGSHVALRITSMSVTISLSATVTIACLFTPKLYIILIHPERNVRPNMMHHRYNTAKGSVVTGTNVSSMMAPVTLTAITCDQDKAVKKHVITTTDCSTQSEQFEMELTERKNGKLPAQVITRSTQTQINNNGKESSNVTSPVIKEIGIEENIKVQNIGKIGNGPITQNELPS